jgi:hypothetical protein
MEQSAEHLQPLEDLASLGAITAPAIYWKPRVVERTPTDRILKKLIAGEICGVQAVRLLDALVKRAPEAVQQGLAGYALQGEAKQVVGLLHTWALGSYGRAADVLLRSQAVLGAIEKTSYTTLALKRQTGVDLGGSFFDLLQHNGSFRRELSGIFIVLSGLNSDLWRQISVMLRAWIYGGIDVGIASEPFELLIVSMFRHSHWPNRNLILGMVHEWTLDSRALVRELGALIEYGLRTSNYPLPDNSGDMEHPQ